MMRQLILDSKTRVAYWQARLDNMEPRTCPALRMFVQDELAKERARLAAFEGHELVGELVTALKAMVAHYDYSNVEGWTLSKATSDALAVLARAEAVQS